MQLRQALEDALAANPEDRATHAAYADYLMEQGDPRGELIQVQLALEDEACPPEERLQWKLREAELLRAHEREWAGELAPHLFEQEISAWRREHNKINRARWARGWIDDLYLHRISLASARALARCEAARLLRRLHVEDCQYEDKYEALEDEGIPANTTLPGLYGLSRAPFLAQLRSFQFGETVDPDEEMYNCTTTARGTVGLVARMTRLEELYLLARGIDLEGLFALPNLTELRVLKVYHGRKAYPLEVLAANPALGKLTTLQVRPASAEEEPRVRRAAARALFNSPHLKSLTHLHLHGSDLGDEGVAGLIASGILKRLKVLDLRFGCIRDDGARLLAQCPDVKGLELLQLEYNQLSEEAEEFLGDVGIPVSCAAQYEDEDAYLMSGDME